jgi:hypothetical protein
MDKAAKPVQPGKRGQPERVDLSDAESLQYWCEQWRVSESELRAAVKKVGTEIPAIAFALGREAY